MKMKYASVLFLSVFLILQCQLPEPRDVVPPTTRVIYPHEGAVVSENVDVVIEASDDDKVAKVWYFVNGVKMGETSKTPYTLSLNIGNLEKGVNHVIQSAARDDEGNTGYSPLTTFTVAETRDNIDPVVTIVNPQSGQVVEDTVLIVAHAEDERSVQKVAFFINGDSVKDATDYTYPYRYEWNTQGLSDSTEHTIFAKAFDGGNNTAISPVIRVTVYPRSGDAGDDIPPSALILYPVAGSAVSGTVTVSVDLRDNVNVSRSEFYVDGVLTESADDPESPWTFDWNTASKADSSLHTLYVKAYDQAGNTGTSALMTVTIQ